MAGIIEVKDQGKLRIYDADNSHYIDIVVPSSVTANRTITIPDASFTVPQVTNATHSGEVTGATALTIADNIVDEANLKVSNSAVNGYMLTAQSGNTGGLTWAAAPVGITSTDQYRLTANLTNPGAADITANLERVDDSVFGRIGTGMSVSSGVYTFPSTGVYRIQMIGHFYIPSGNDGAASVDTLISPDSGSNYDILASAVAGSTAGGQLYNTHPSECFVNVTNATNFRVKFTTGSMAATVLVGSTSLNATSFSFIRLGDTY